MTDPSLASKLLEGFLDIAGRFDQILWGPWTIVFIASVSIYLTVRTRFFQIRKLGLILGSTFGRLFEKYEDRGKGKMTPFQAVSTALASTVGMGSIAGVAAALALGGPGSIFWMWLLALLGTITKTAEITLAVHYRDVEENGRFRGGPMYYIRKGLGWPLLAGLFSGGIFVNALLSASLLQAHTVGRAFLAAYDINPYVVAGIMTAVTAIVVLGGLRRIGRFSERLVPLMSVVYVVAGLALFLMNYRAIPEVFALIFKHAFAPMPAVGGFAGATVLLALQTGMARGMFGNEAGMGTAPMAHATADTEHPFEQGLWGAFEVFVVTFIICTITSFAVLSTGVLASGKSGIELVMVAFGTVFPEQIAGALISFCILTFCLTTQIGFFIYYETASVNLFGKGAMKYVKWLYFIPPLIFAGVADVERVWVFANIAVGLCAIPNLVAVLALSGGFLKLMQDYLSGRNEYAARSIDISKNYVKRANKA